eukprot:6184131-Pleurochrysis_carterae.AAC.1
MRVDACHNTELVPKRAGRAATSRVADKNWGIIYNTCKEHNMPNENAKAQITLCMKLLLPCRKRAHIAYGHGAVTDPLMTQRRCRAATSSSTKGELHPQHAEQAARRGRMKYDKVRLYFMNNNLYPVQCPRSRAP